MKLYQTAMLLIALTAAGCGTTRVDLLYRPSEQRTPIQGKVSVLQFEDMRPQGENYLGAIRDGYGSPLKKLELAQPAREVVRKAFTDALTSRRLLSPSGSSTLSGRILKFDCSQYVRREAHVTLEIFSEGRRGSFRKTYKKTKVSGSLFALDTGPLASVEDLRVVMEQALNELIDDILRDPEFIRHLSQNGAS